MSFEVVKNTVLLTRRGETIRLTPCAADSIRFESFPNETIEEQNWTLMPQKVSGCAFIEAQHQRAVLEVGCLRAEVYYDGKMIFYKNGREILREAGHTFKHIAGPQWEAQVTFRAHDGEHFYGLGHESTDCFDLKGCSVDLCHLNGKCTIPFVYSSFGYGFLWNSPATGRCELACNRTRFASDSTKKLDYVVIGGTPRTVASTLSDLTGHAPVMPHWATGFWQSRMRYETQEEVLAVARKYKELGIPLSVIVIDFFHWTEQGEYKFDPAYWPDPAAMTKELHEMGIKAVVSVWPTINEHSENYAYMLDHHMLMRSTRGMDRFFLYQGASAMIDPSDPATRQFVWDKIKANYIDKGIDAIWLDVAEPEIAPAHFDNMLLSVGQGSEAGLLYPYYYTQMIHDGMKQCGRDDIVTLVRCAYTGSQKFGALVWSGDILSTFQSLREQVKAGLNMAMCGIPWWNTDIGGFCGSDIHSDYFRELIVRWFQYGVFCPVTRLHGARGCQDMSRDIKEPTGDENELWSFGKRDFGILKNLVLLREKLRPYIEQHMQIASKQGVPVMRPMFFDYPDDPICYTTGEQYLFGDDILFAPVVNEGQTEKEVYLPAGRWVLTKDGTVYEGGAWYTVTVPLCEFAAFVREGADVLRCFTEWRQEIQ